MLVPQHFDIYKGFNGLKAIGTVQTDHGIYYYHGTSTVLYNIDDQEGFTGLLGETINFLVLVTAKEFNQTFRQLLGVELTEEELEECLFDSTYVEQTTRVDTWKLFKMVKSKKCRIQSKKKSE